MILCLLLFLLFIFILFNSLLLYSIVNLKNNSPSVQKIPISILVAAKNEEENVEDLLNSLCRQNYPSVLLEIIFIDDDSSDSTFQLASEFAQRSSNIKVIRANQKELPGKKGALTIGIQHATNPYILITDADCISEQNWVSSFADKFSSGYDLLFGIAPFIQENNLVNKLACFDELRSSILTFGLAGFGLPYSAAARSFGFTQESYNKIEGYKNTAETLSGDDDLLIREAVKNSLKIGTVTADNSRVFSPAKSTFKDYLSQKARHTSTSNYYLFKHKLILTAWHLLNLGFLFSPVLTGFSELFWLPFVVKLIVDFITIRGLQIKFSYKFGMAEIFPLQITYELMLVAIYFLSFSRKNKW